ncbi:hypothetical protein SPHINGO8AM_230019 [Sphingomonas sp. 8AM]|nr:hypothetical protein SPHINGO8AM_230019 [Sphingomonas sp. 8AM]
MSGRYRRSFDAPLMNRWDAQAAGRRTPLPKPKRSQGLAAQAASHAAIRGLCLIQDLNDSVRHFGAGPHAILASSRRQIGRGSTLCRR